MLRLDKLVISRAGRALAQPISVTMQAGQVWGILGPNGVGKSTLLHTIAGLDAALSGVVKQDDHRTGILLQNIDYRFPETVQENLYNALAVCQPRQSKAHNAEQIAAALQDWYLSDHIDQFIQSLSGGERQRLALARLALQRPAICLYDEPTNHLDLQYRGLLADRIKMLSNSKQASVQIIAAHDLTWAAQTCSHFITLHKNGEVVVGTCQHILQQALLSELYDCALKVTEIDGQLLVYPTPV